MDQNNVMLAEYPGLGNVRLCECKSIHLKIGPITVTLAPEAFAQAACMIRHAMESLAVIAAAGELEPEALQRVTPQQSQFTH
ncbi:MAG TPA: hypothetical protein VGC07_04765 [Granulicella sp.]